MNNTIMSSKNTFEGGLLMDFAPDNMASNVMTSALNATLLTFNGNEMLLQNDMGNGRVETARLPDGYVPVGTCEFGDIIYIVSYNPILNKSQIGCFPSPERNISSEEIGDLSQTLSSADFQELIDGNPTGKLKATSVKKILYGSKNMNSGDKYIIYSEDLEGNSKYLSDYGNLSHQHNSFPKLVKIHVVSIEESGKIVYLDSTTKWYDNDYYISGEGRKNGEDKLDIDSYRTLVSSAYSVFSSKVSGKLALLIELEKITGFSCSWEPYIKNYETKDGIDYVNYAIHWNFNWTTNDNNINPNGALLTTSEWMGNYYYLNNDLKKTEGQVNIPKVILDKGPSIEISRYYKPEDNNISYSDYINEYQYDKYLETTLSGIQNPYKLNILINDSTGLPQRGKYYINCTKIEHSEKTEELEVIPIDQDSDLQSNYYISICVNTQVNTATRNLINYGDNQISYYDGSEGIYRFIVNDISDQDRILYAVGKKLVDGNYVNSLIQVAQDQTCELPGEIGEVSNLSWYKGNEFLLSGINGSFIFNKKNQQYYKLNFDVDKYFNKKYWRSNQNVLYRYSLEGNLEKRYEFDKIIQSFYIDISENIYILNNNNIYKYKITEGQVGYTINNGTEEVINPIELNDDIVNNYFNYPVIKPFTYINNNSINEFTFQIPINQTITKDETTYVSIPDISNLVYHYKIAPTMPYGYLEEFTQEGFIDFSKIGKKDIQLKTWKYYNYGNTTTLTWGMDAYTEPGKGISEVVFEFYDNQGLAAAYHVSGKNSYNGTFTEYLILNADTPKLNNIDHNNTLFRHKGRYVSDINEAIDGKGYCHEGRWFEKSAIDNGVIYQEDDAGILYSNCLYLVKIIVKYCNKGILGNYIESGTEYIEDYRWIWTNNLFNANYYNTSDFKDLQFELDLNCVTHLQGNENYKVKQVEYVAPEQNELINNSDIYKTLSATVQAINPDGSDKDNIKLSLTAGLINDFNTFNLNNEVLNVDDEPFRVSVFLGDEYIKQQSPELLFTENKVPVNEKLIQPIGRLQEKPEKEPAKMRLSLPVIEMTSNDRVKITHLLSDVELFYRIGSDTSWNIYVEPVAVLNEHLALVEAYAKKEGYLDSNIAKLNLISTTALNQDTQEDTIIDGVSKGDEFEYLPGDGLIEKDDWKKDEEDTIQVLSPTIICSDDNRITIESNAPLGIDYTTYYTTDNTTPDSSTTIYNNPFPITETTTIKVVNYYLGRYSPMIVKKIVIEKNTPDEPSESPYKGDTWVFENISQNLHNLLGTNLTSGNPDIYNNEVAYKNYENRFVLTSDGNTNTNASYIVPEETFYYQPSEGEMKSIDGLTGYEIGLSNVVNDNAFFLTLTGIHYSKYSYTTAQDLNTKVLRSFVLTPNELYDYNITTHGNKPYFNKIVVTTMGDSTGTDAHQYTSILSFSNKEYNELEGKFGYKITDVVPRDDYDKNSNGNISVQKGLEKYYDDIQERFSFMFPFGYGIPEDYDLNHTEAKIDKNIVSENKKYKVDDYWYVPDKALGGTIAGITEDSVQPADNHLMTDNPDILSECAEIVTGYLTQLFYLSDSLGVSIYNPNNFIYLKPNQYSYKRDIIIHLKTKDGLNDHNNLILMRGIRYGDFENDKGYVSTLLSNIFNDQTKINKFKSQPNVNLQLKDHIQTAPLEYVANYISPNTFVNDKIYVRSIFTDIIPSTTSQYIQPNTIYGWDNDTKRFNILGGIPKLHRISEFKEFNTTSGEMKADLDQGSFNLGKVNSERCLDIAADNKLKLKSFPTATSNTYTVKTEGTYGLTGFKKFKLYE